LQKANLFLKQRLKEFEELEKLVKSAGVNAMAGSLAVPMVDPTYFPSTIASLYQ